MIQTIFATPIYKSDNLYNLSESELNVLNNLKMKPNRAGNEVPVEKEIFENHKQLSELKKSILDLKIGEFLDKDIGDVQFL